MAFSTFVTGRRQAVAADEAVNMKRRFVSCSSILAAMPTLPSIATDNGYSFGDELAASVIHGVGIVLSIAGLAILVAFAALHGDVRVVVASAVYGTTLVLLTLIRGLG